MSTRHLLVTNDFPPKIGGIQSYLWELWRRLDPERFVVLTTAHPDAAAFDPVQPFRIERVPETQMLPTPSLRARVDRLAAEAGVDLAVLDPVLPLGLIGPRLSLPYAVVLHGAEVTVPGRLPVSSSLMAMVLRRAVRVIAAGGYPAAEARRVAAGRLPPVTIVAPGVDCDRFRPVDAGLRAAVRERFGIHADAPLVVSVSRLVPRKGMDVLIEASARLAPRLPGLVVAIAGKGRDLGRLNGIVVRTGAPVRLLGEVPDADLADLVGSADAFAMLCRNRWLGLEQEGFGIVFLEASACGVPVVAGASGGAAEAVEDGVTGVVLSRPEDPAGAADALWSLLSDRARAAAMGAAGRQRAEAEFSYDRLATDLGEALGEAGG